MVVLKKLLYILLISISALHGSAVLAELNVTVDRNPVYLEDEFKILIEITGGSPSDVPDLSSLNNSFEIISTELVSQASSGFSFSFGNGGLSGTQNSSGTTIAITVRSKDIGVFTIPSLNWEGQKSTAFTVTVKNTPETTFDGTTLQEPVFIRSELSNSTPYVQEQNILTVKLFSQEEIYDGKLLAPSIPDGINAKGTGDKDLKYKTKINNVDYYILERKYIIHTEKSGDFEIGSVLFKGKTIARQDRYGRTTHVNTHHVRSNKIDLTVKPTPNGAKQPWLPAKQLTLSHYLSEGEFNVGEPITLTLSTIADGLMAEQIPDIDLKLPKNLKSYPDQAEIDTNWKDGSVTAQRTDKIALIPTQPGHYELPPIQLHWWNTTTDKAEIATIDGISFDVGGVAASANIDSVNTPDNIEQENAAALPEQRNVPVPASQPMWKTISMGLATAWLITLLALILVLRRTPRSKPVTTAKPSIECISKKQLLKNLKKALPQDAAEQLVRWARGDIDTKINTIGQIIAHADKPLQVALEELNAQLYCAGESSWNSDKLVAALQTLQLSVEKKPEQVQPRLYPE